MQFVIEVSVEVVFQNAGLRVCLVCTGAQYGPDQDSVLHENAGRVHWSEPAGPCGAAVPGQQ